MSISYGEFLTSLLKTLKGNTMAQRLLDLNYFNNNEYSDLVVEMLNKE